MALADALVFAAKAWPRLREGLTPDEVTEITRALAAAVHGASWDPNALMGTLLAHEPDDDPAWEALAASSARRTAAPAPLMLAAATRLRFAIETTPPERTEPGLGPDAVERSAEQRLWLAPMQQLSETTAPRSTLLVLVRQGREVAPTFQFDSWGNVLPAVADVNAELDASEDPWGAASWWLTPHAGLQAIPADALRTGDEDLVLAAAAAAGERG